MFESFVLPQCQFKSQQISTALGSAQIFVWIIPSQPGALCGTVNDVAGNISVVGSHLAPQSHHANAYLNYNITVN